MKQSDIGARETTQQFRALLAPAEDLDSIPGTCTEAHSCL